MHLRIMKLQSIKHVTELSQHFTRFAIATRGKKIQPVFGLRTVVLSGRLAVIETWACPEESLCDHTPILVHCSAQ